MKRINEAIAEKRDTFSKGQKLLASYILEHCDKTAFLSSFELAAITGLSQSTVVRFATAIGYDGYSDFQVAMQTELKYRLSALERFELSSEGAKDDELIKSVALYDALNIKKNADSARTDAIKNLCTRLMLSSRVMIYGQGMAFVAANYLASYLRILLPNVYCINQLGVEPISGIGDINSGDLLLCISFPLHTETTKNLLAYAKMREVCIVTISESNDSEIAQCSDLNISCECGESGINGSIAPAISLCCSICCLLARCDERAEKRLKEAREAVHFKGII